MHVFRRAIGQLRTKLPGLDDRILEVVRYFLELRLLLGNDVVTSLDTDRCFLELFLEFLEICLGFVTVGLRNPELGFE